MGEFIGPVHLLSGTGGYGTTKCGVEITSLNVDQITYTSLRHEVTCSECISDVDYMNPPPDLVQSPPIPDYLGTGTFGLAPGRIIPTPIDPDKLIREYADKITSIAEKGTDGDYTWLGLLAEFTMKLQGRM